MRGLHRLTNVLSVGILLLSTGAFAGSGPAIPPTAAELAALSELPKGFVVWGGTWGPNDGETTHGVYFNSLGDTAWKLLDAAGTNPTINPKDPSLLAYISATTSTTADIWLMNWQGQNKRKITRTPMTQNALSCLRWTDQNKLTITGMRPNPEYTYANDSLYLIDTLGNISMINTGISWNNIMQVHGFDGLMAVGNRITFRSLGGKLPNSFSSNFVNEAGGNNTDGVNLAQIDQGNPGSILTYVYSKGQCGSALSYITNESGAPVLHAINKVNHDGYQIHSGIDGSLKYEVPLSPSKGKDVHFWCWAVNDTNWAYTATRDGAFYPYVVNAHSGKMYRVGYGPQGAAYGSLYIGTMVSDSAALDVSAPVKGATFGVGDSLQVQWTLLRNSGKQMNVYITADSTASAITWHKLNGSAIAPTSALWGNFKWRIDSTISATSLLSTKCAVKVEDVSGTPVKIVGRFTIRRKSAVDTTSVNLALNHCDAAKSAECYYAWSNPEYAFDGDLTNQAGGIGMDGFYPCGTCNPTNKPLNPFLVADFGTVGFVHKVVVVLASSDANTFGKYRIDISTDGSTWTEVATITPTTATSEQVINATCQYIRYAGIDRWSEASSGDHLYWYRVREIEAWGYLTNGTGSTGPTKLSRTGWTATASNSAYQATAGSTWAPDPNTSTPSSVLDGSTGSVWSLFQKPGQVADQWFMIDMGLAQNVGGINISTASTTNGDYLRDYQIFVSNSTASWGTAVMQGTGNSPNQTIMFPTSVHGQYIKIKQTGNNSINCWWTIAELNVYAGDGTAALRSPRIYSVNTMRPAASRVMYSINGRKIGTLNMHARGNGLYLTRGVKGASSAINKMMMIK